MGYLIGQFEVALLDSLAAFRKLNFLEEGDDVLLPEDALVLLLQVDKGVGGLGMPDVRQPSLDPKVEVVCNHLQSNSRSVDQKILQAIYSGKS